MSNVLYDIYGIAKDCPWFPGLEVYHCQKPDHDLPELNRNIPSISALYFLCANRGISYIGISGIQKSGGLFKRLHQHWNDTRKPMYFCYAFEMPREVLRKWEAKAIGLFRPEWNENGRDFTIKSYNDHIAGMSSFLYDNKYFSLYPAYRRFRIDFGNKHEYSIEELLASYQENFQPDIQRL